MYYIKTKKRANSRAHDKIIAQFKDEQSLIDYLKPLTNTVFKPYFFTNIGLPSGWIIEQRDDLFNLICSPIELIKALETAGFGVMDI